MALQGGKVMPAVVHPIAQSCGGVWAQTRVVNRPFNLRQAHETESIDSLWSALS